MNTQKIRITVSTKVNAPVEQVWNLWTDPRHIVHWNYASDNWHTPAAENDLRVGGKFLWRMEAKDGSAGFDFSGEYDTVDLFKRIAYTLADNRKVEVIFTPEGNQALVKEIFEAEQTHTPEMQQAGWQAILDNFRKYAEARG